MNQKKQVSLDECVFVILGATGDLTKRKLIPAIYQLIASGELTKFAFVGASITDTTIETVLGKGRSFIKNIDEKVWEKLVSAAYYQQMDFHDKKAYKKLHDLVEDVEKKQNLKSNRLFYLATMPQHFADITKHLADNDIAKKGTWSRVVYEKPFGFDLKSARKINRTIARLFDENQVYRIDHYLGKELVANIAIARFTNQVLEPLWNKDYIDSVQIVMSEKIGIEGRGDFYDRYGALKDVVQNHMLQMLALVAIDAPRELFTAEYLRSAKAKVLSKVQVDSVVLGQYAGYKDEHDILQDSKTETFAALKLKVNNNRWKGVPFYLKTGKHLKKKQASIHIIFKKVRCLLDFCPMESNYFSINIDPEEGFRLGLNVKVPGVFDQATPVSMDFAHDITFGPNTAKAYEVLLADVIRGDHFAFIRSDEIIESWKVIEEVFKKKGQLHSYEKGSDGPKELEKLDPGKTIRWKT